MQKSTAVMRNGLAGLLMLDSGDLMTFILSTEIYRAKVNASQFSSQCLWVVWG